MKKPLLFIVAWIWAAIIQVSGQQKFSELSAAQKKLYKEHIVEGQPDGEKPVYVRQGYVMRYNEVFRIPDWVCYHIKPDYLNAPERERRFGSFKTDPQVPDPVTKDEYTGSGFDRGHMAPFFAMGGDRDKNNFYSDAEDRRRDPYDDSTAIQANFMSNITPQDPGAFNGSAGPWNKLETFIRKVLVGDNNMELNIYTGAIVSDPDHFEVVKTGKRKKTGIAVPDQFYQILIFKDKATKEYITGAFLFPHVRDRSDLPFEDLLDYMVPVDDIEKLTGLNFLSELSDNAQKKIESKTNREFWEKIN
ncbi:DNA/RNA non-specific endonuclease [Chryseolinea soli]|uniref:DNA/RNA non-specific endonuclease n=1 Tax=Chryseolinea soli TaxID=2321403 RepID=A0A385SPJ1_9BACT|nr:DNA/RNA non-specific endonuclease [Chryseolinea soli]AYB32187.1 DNA/RNA non-specific endonuclease [Chryseolinea soli]